MTMTLRFLFFQAAVAISLTAQMNVVTNRYDQFASGANPREVILNPANVERGTFGKLYSY